MTTPSAARATPLHLTNTQLVYQAGTTGSDACALNLQDTAVDLPAPGATAVALPVSLW